VRGLEHNEERLEGTEIVQSGQEEAQGRPYCSTT